MKVSVMFAVLHRALISKISRYTNAWSEKNGYLSSCLRDRARMTYFLDFRVDSSTVDKQAQLLACATTT
ncbi:unnamed protein product [Clavelina lepadiformis]|uniref:Uncharacterized protein n=1 Tax=Clavelina lepadiformis TaxID=159417 RepID=A0ABP0FX55_CLALP